MSEPKVVNRWLVVVGGTIIQLCLGAVYAWSAFTQELTEGPFNFSRMQTQLIFSVELLTFAIVMALVAGKWQKKAGPRKVAMAGGFVLGAGYILAGFLGNSFWGILVGVGLVGGSGIGLAYVCPIAALVKWFPDKKGLITGLAVAGFGFGALIWIKLTQGFKFGPIDFTPGWKGLYGMDWSVSEVFVLYGILFALLVCLGSLVLVNPPKGWSPEGWTPPSADHLQHSGGVDYSVSEMVKTPQYWMLFFAFLVGTTSGVMVIGVIKLFGVDALASSGIAGVRADVITGTAMGLFYALFNGLGRIIWGAVSDKLGPKNSIVLMSTLQGMIMILFYFIGNTEWGLYLGATIIGFNYGGNFALFPVATADFFGNKNVGTNYPWVFLSFGAGGVLGPILGGIMGDAKAWMWAFIPAGVACLVAALICT
ncbi:MAG: putative MFS-type transporter YhjX, partial [Chlamydiae bacterium]|nr:putative MFS-type transporter YhjX [Chlamydiota bacterium]